jgi:hypothetical protein
MTTGKGPPWAHSEIMRSAGGKKGIIHRAFPKMSQIDENKPEHIHGSIRKSLRRIGRILEAFQKHARAGGWFSRVFRNHARAGGWFSWHPKTI